MLIIAFSLRHQIAELLPNLKRIKYKDFEAAFGEQLAEAEKEVPAKERAVSIKAIDESEFQRFQQLAEMSPNASVMEAWLPVEATLIKVAKSRGHNMARGSSPLYLIRMLGSKNVLSPQLVALLNDLRTLRNTAAHAIDKHKISIEQALRFKELASYTLSELEKILEALEDSS